MAGFNIANSLALPQWGQAAGQNIRQARQEARELEQQNMLAQALPMALSGDQNALAQVYAVNPTVGYRIQSDMQEQKALSAKAKREQVESQRGHFLDAAVGALASVSQMPEAEREAAWRAQEDDLMRRFPDFVDQEPDSWEKARTVAPRLASADKKYGDILGRYGLIPQEPEQATTEQRNYEYGLKNPAFVAEQERLKRAGAASTTVSYGGLTEAIDPATGERIFVQSSNRGGVLPVQGAKPPPNAAATKDPTEDQSKAAAWFSQAEKALGDMKSALAEDPKAAQPNLVAETLDRVPLAGEYMRNKTLTPGQQRYQQAVRSFSEATLRAATGAGVTKQEHEEKLRELTPRPGDTAEVIAQKEASMLVYLDSLKNRAGRALKQSEVPAAGAANPERPPLSSFGG